MKKKLLLLTDLYYQAKGRDYYKEDLELGRYLRSHFTLYLTHPDDAGDLVDKVDVVLLRNTGPQMLHKASLAALRARKELVLFNDLLGKGDINGKQHLLDLYKAGYPVIPSFSKKADVAPDARYLLKPLHGADSTGVQIVSWHELQEVYADMVLQPLLDFEYEVSFYFINNNFYYALYAPDPACRWKLTLYEPTAEDLAFAERFIAWNSCRRGIQRVDACRLTDGRLLLMELEDYNPFLSLDLLPERIKRPFMDDLCQELLKQ
jgi:hypothetical protein